jgi:hypothetical protein
MPFYIAPTLPAPSLIANHKPPHKQPAKPTNSPINCANSHLLRYFALISLCFFSIYGVAQRPSHTAIWENSFGGDILDIATAIAPTPIDGGYIFTGYTKSVGAGSEDVWLVKTDKTGQVLWQKTIGGIKNDAANSIVPTTDGGYIIAGYTYSKGSGQSDVWVIKTNSKGNPEWENTFGGLEADQAIAVLPTSDDSYIVAAYHFKEAKDAKENTATKAPISNPSNASGSYIPKRYQTIWLLKLNKSGNLVWNQTYDLAGVQSTPTAMLQLPDNGILIVGNTLTKDRSSDALLLKIKSDGSQEWQKTLGTNAWDALQSAALTPDGQIVVGGTQSVGKNNNDAWLIKLSQKGDIIWETTFGSPENETVQTLTVTKNNHIALGVNISSPYTQPDMWMFARFNAQGVMQENQVVGSSVVQQIRAIQEAPNDGFVMLGVPTVMRKCLQRGDRSTWLFRWGLSQEIGE